MDTTTLRTTVATDQKQVLVNARAEHGDVSKITREALKEWCEKRDIIWPVYLFIQNIGVIPVVNYDERKQNDE